MRPHPRPADFRTPREVVQEISDDEEDWQAWEMDEGPVYTTRDEASARRSKTKSMNANHTPASPSTFPSPPLSRPSFSSAGANPGPSRIHSDPSPHAMGFRPHQSPAETWYNAGVYNNHSHNTTTTDTRDSNNDSSMNIGDSEW